MSKFEKVINEYVVSNEIDIVITPPQYNSKHNNIINYIHNNKDIDLTEPVLQQINICTDANDIEQYLIDGGYTFKDLAQMYKTLYYEI